MARYDGDNPLIGTREEFSPGYQTPGSDVVNQQTIIPDRAATTMPSGQSLFDMVMGIYGNAPQTAQQQQPAQESKGNDGGGQGTTVPSGPQSFFGGWNSYQPQGLRGAPGPISGQSPLSGLQFGAPPPQYQAYQFNQQTMTPTVLQGQAPPPIQRPQGYQAGQVGQFTPQQSQYSPMMDQLIQQMMGNAIPNTGAMKEVAKENLLQINQDNLDAIMQSAAGRGTMGGGRTLANELGERQNFAGELTGAYRDIDLASQQQAFDNAMSGATTLGNIDAQRQGLAQSNYQTTLQGQMAQQSLNQAQAQFDQARAEFDLATQRFGLDHAQAAFGQQLAMAQQNLQVQQSQANQNQGAAELALQQYLGVGDLNLRRTAAQSQDEVARNQAAFNQALGTGQFGLQEQNFGLDLRQAAFQEWLNKAQMDQSAAQHGASMGMQSRGLDLQEANSTYQKQKDFIDIIMGLTR